MQRVSRHPETGLQRKALFLFVVNTIPWEMRPERRAACAILDYSMKGAELLDLETRIAVLEEAAR